MVFLDPVLNPVLGPFLNWNPALLILFVSLIISVIITVVYKFATNQKEMKRLKEQQKEFQKSMKELRHNPEEMMKIQKEAMKSNMDYMKHSLKSTLITMLPIILIFSWMAGHLSFEPIYPGEQYSMTATFAKGVTGNAQLIPDKGTELSSEATQPIINREVTWRMKSTEGSHLLTVKSGETEQQKKVLITKELAYEPQISQFSNSDIEKVTVNYNKLKPLGGFHILSWYPGWLAIYFISSIAFSLGLRKLLKVY
ncbi:MAG TPA: EMC3/TMCO1 family protein [Candidatus Nanoarchaeia archaeon]|nr:EMC3/TMCO1 family protein [Candidatus Nanoarchaeia archaeon]